jgi:hypothetical protein
MMGSPKTLKRNNEECQGILIGPSMAPRFFGVCEICFRFFPCSVACRLRAQILRHGWRAHILELLNTVLTPLPK